MIAYNILIGKLTSHILGEQIRIHSSNKCPITYSIVMQLFVADSLAKKIQIPCGCRCVHMIQEVSMLKGAPFSHC